MPRTFFSAALVAVATLAASSSFAAGEADTYRDQLNAPSVAQRSRTEVRTEAVQAARHGPMWTRCPRACPPSSRR